MFPKPLVIHQITAFHTKESYEMPNCQNQPLNKFINKLNKLFTIFNHIMYFVNYLIISQYYYIPMMNK